MKTAFVLAILFVSVNTYTYHQPIDCWSKPYSRGVGKPACKSGYKGVGPVCWKHCPADSKACGNLCLLPHSGCNAFVKTLETYVTGLVVTKAKSKVGKVDIYEILKGTGSIAYTLYPYACDSQRYLRRMLAFVHN